MANPALVKAAVQVAANILTDEKSRNKVLMIIAAPIIGVVLLISMIFYTLTMPFTMVVEFFTGNQYAYASEFRAENGSDQYLDPNSEFYIEGEGQDYSGLTFTDAQTEVVYYSQLDPRWKNTPYGKNSGNTIGIAGCGPTSLAIVVSSLTDSKVDPTQTAKWAYNAGQYMEGAGSYHSIIPRGAENYGLKVESCPKTEPQRVLDALADGKLVVVIVGKGTFTTSGHFFVLRGVTADGKILIADPASRKNSEKAWDFSIILKDARGNAGAGGPFWIVSN